MTLVISCAEVLTSILVRCWREVAKGKRKGDKNESR